jgi:DNA-binding GntR family transcriptional regulator
LNDELATAAPGSTAREVNRQFHRTLLDSARNRFLVKAMNALQRTLLILGPSTLADGTRATDAVAEHAEILRALSARDGEAAEAAMRLHIEAALRSRIRAMRGRDIPLEDEA